MQKALGADFELVSSRLTDHRLRQAAISNSSTFICATRRSSRPVPTVSDILRFVKANEADGWAALGDPTRLAIAEQLAEGPKAVGELAAALPVSRPAVSQHLKVLKDAGLVTDRPEGTPADLSNSIRAASRTFANSSTASGPRACTPTRRSLRNQQRRENEHGRRRRSSARRSSWRSRLSAPSAPSPRSSTLLSRASTTCSQSDRRGSPFSSPASAGASTIAASTAANAKWARVLAFEPPDRVVFELDISPRWQIESDPEQTSEVEVRFVADGPTRTRVELEHRKLERHGEGWQQLRAGVEGDGGWPLYLDRFAEQICAA